MLKTFKAVLVAAICLPAVTAAQDLDRMTAEELLPLAQQEGSVMVFSLSSRIARVEKAFEEKYPGIDLIGLDISSAKQIARIKAEQQAGIFEVDVLYLADTPMVLSELLEPGMIHTYVPPRLEDQIDPENKAPFLAHRLSTKVLMYNEVAYPDGSPVTNLWQLTTPQWRGKVLMGDPTQRGETLAFLTEIALHADEMAAAYKAQFGKDIEVDGDLNGAGEQFIRDLYANDLVLVASTDLVNAAVGPKDAQDPPVGIGTYSDRRDNEEEGWALQLANDVEPISGISYPAALALVEKPPHPAAARLLIDFMFGDDSPGGGPGFAPFNVPGEYAARKTIVGDPDTIPRDRLNTWMMDAEAVAGRRGEIADLLITLQ